MRFYLEKDKKDILIVLNHIKFVWQFYHTIFYGVSQSKNPLVNLAVLHNEKSLKPPPTLVSGNSPVRGNGRSPKGLPFSPEKGGAPQSGVTEGASCNQARGRGDDGAII